MAMVVGCVPPPPMNREEQDVGVGGPAWCLSGSRPGGRPVCFVFMFCFISPFMIFCLLVFLFYFLFILALENT